LSENRTQLKFVPAAGGAGRELPLSGLIYQWARLFPAEDRLLVLANYPNQPLGLYVQTITTGKAAPLTGPLMVRNAAISPDGKTVAVLTPEGSLILYSTADGSQRTVSTGPPLAPIRWSRDSEWIYVQHLRSAVQSSSDVSRIRAATGEIRFWKKIAPRDPTGVNSITGVVIADDEQSYAYSYRRVLSDLFIAQGWK